MKIAVISKNVWVKILKVLKIKYNPYPRYREFVFKLIYLKLWVKIIENDFEHNILFEFIWNHYCKVLEKVFVTSNNQLQILILL